MNIYVNKLSRQSYQVLDFWGRGGGDGGNGGKTNQFSCPCYMHCINKQQHEAQEADVVQQQQE